MRIPFCFYTIKMRVYQRTTEKRKREVKKKKDSPKFPLCQQQHLQAVALQAVARLFPLVCFSVVK